MTPEVQLLQEQIAALRAENARLRAAPDAHAGNRQQCATILSLPTEMLDRVFQQLSDRKSDIAACRLVCRKFHDISSPLLITSVIFSRRLDTLHKLYDVLEHPYFRRHVTELVWDAGSWSEGMALDLQDYWESAARSSRAYKDEKAEAELKTWNALCLRIYDGGQGPTNTAADQPFGQLDDEYGGQHVSNFRCSHVLGQYQYGRFWIVQKAMDERDLPKDILRKCLLKLPKLRSLVYTDFRALAKDGDRNYQQFCERTLGHAAPPIHFRSEEVDDRVMFADLWMILEQLATEDTPLLSSFSVGHNPFGVPLSVDEEVHTGEDERPQALSHRYLCDNDNVLSKTLDCFHRVRELRLPQIFHHVEDEDEEESIEKRINTSCVPKLLAVCD